MHPQPPIDNVHLAVVIVVGIAAWYLYEVGSRKQARIRFKAERAVVAIVVYLLSVVVLAQQKLPEIEVVVFGGLAGLGCAWLLVDPPKNNRRVSKAIRRQVIARDLTSKGILWDPTKHHIDHIVPHSRGGDNSLRNLRVIEKGRNLRKGGKMPGLWEFMRKF